MSDDTLDYWLGRLYKYHVVETHPMEDRSIMDLFRKRMDASLPLRESAQSQLIGISDEITKRCFISKKNRDFLTTALGA